MHATCVNSNKSCFKGEVCKLNIDPVMPWTIGCLS